MFVQMKHTWLNCCQCKAACQRICLTGTNKQLWGAWKVPKLWPSPLSRLPASAIKVRQSFTLAHLHLWRCAPPRRLAQRDLPPRPSCLLVPEASVTHLSFLSSTPTSPSTLLQRGRQEGNHRSENGDHFVPVSGVLVKADASGRRCLTDAAC